MVTTLLDAGIPTTLVNAATTTGAAASNPFGVQQATSGQPRTGIYSCAGTYTVCTAHIQVLDKGTNGWVDDSMGLLSADFFANKSGIIPNLVPGTSYRFYIDTFTGTSITITGEAS